MRSRGQYVVVHSRNLFLNVSYDDVLDEFVDDILPLPPMVIFLQQTRH